MSKGGGAGKVYFVLYLAVVLELLIIIVERDEAEEGLQRKQKETMKIVESILSQLQSGAGTEGINTRPQDEITLFDKGSVEALGPNGKNIKSNRKYIVEVGVTDVSTDIQRKENEPEKEYFERLAKYSKLANVEEIEYQIFYAPPSENIPMFYSEDSLKRKNINMVNLEPDQTKIPGPDGSEWTFLSSRKLVLDIKATNDKINPSGKTIGIEELDPIYQPAVVKANQSYAPPGMNNDSVFFYSIEKTRDKLVSVGGKALLKRAFEINFQPSDKDGWFKLRFVSRTNRILGVRADAKVDELSEETTVNIGTVQLTVRDLNKVKKELQTKLEKYNLPSYDLLASAGDVDKFDEGLETAIRNAALEREGSEDAKSKIKLFGYIAKLLAPGQSVNFGQNKGSIEFNIKVNKLAPQTIDPKILLDDDVNMVFFDAVKPYFKFSVIPYKDAASLNGIDLVLKTDDGRSITVNKNDITPIGVSATGGPQGGGQKGDFIAKINDFIEGGTGQPRIVTISGKYNANNKTDTASARMLIYKTGMNDEADLREQLKNDAFIGNYLNPELMLMPNSAGKIRNDRFQILFTVNNEQKSPIDGLKIPFNGFYFPDGGKTASFKIFWKKPLNNEPIEIFSSDMAITLAKPRLSGFPKADFRGPDNDMIVKIGEIVLQRPPSGKTNEYLETQVSANVTVSGAPLKVRGTAVLTPVGNITPDMKNVKYNMTIRLQGELDPEKTEFRGRLNVNVNAVATTKSGEKTPTASKTYNIDFRYRPEIGE